MGVFRGVLQAVETTDMDTRLNFTSALLVNWPNKVCLLFSGLQVVWGWGVIGHLGVKGAAEKGVWPGEAVAMHAKRFAGQ